MCTAVFNEDHTRAMHTLCIDSYKAYRLMLEYLMIHAFKCSAHFWADNNNHAQSYQCKKKTDRDRERGMEMFGKIDRQGEKTKLNK